MTDATATDVPFANATSEKTPPKPVAGPVLIGDILTTRIGRPTLLCLWEEWEQQVEDDR